MKRILSTSPVIICILYAFLPICKIIAGICGYDFILLSYPISIIALAVISIVALVPLIFLKISLNKVQAMFSALILPLSTINGLIFLFESNWKPILIFVMIGWGCSIIMLFKFAYPSALKIISPILSFFLVLFLLSFSFIDSVLEDFGCNTLVKSIASPQNTYTAEVIDYDQGALGGATHVDIRYNNKVINLFFCKFVKASTLVYTGEWDAFKTMQILWKNEHTLIIDNKEYDLIEITQK